MRLATPLWRKGKTFLHMEKSQIFVASNPVYPARKQGSTSTSTDLLPNGLKWWSSSWTKTLCCWGKICLEWNIIFILCEILFRLLCFDTCTVWWENSSDRSMEAKKRLVLIGFFNASLFFSNRVFHDSCSSYIDINKSYNTSFVMRREGRRWKEEWHEVW